jgi:transcriptional regulator of acetoin/glycerol metabolism
VVERISRALGSTDDRTTCLNTATRWGLTDDEWRVARTVRVNVLLVGPDRVAQKIVAALRPDFSQPITAWRPGSPLVLPAASNCGTLLLQNIEALSWHDQLRLCHWLEFATGRPRVVSTSPQPMFRLGEPGTFCAALYYRLNILCFDVTERESS